MLGYVCYWVNRFVLMLLQSSVYNLNNFIMSNDEKACNPLFSSTNALSFTTNSLFMPVQEQASAILSPEKDIDNDEDIAQMVDGTFQQQNVATFSMFSQKSDQTSDPFAGIITSPSLPREHQPSPSRQVMTQHHEPQLFVPPASPSEQNQPNVLQPNLPQPNTLFPSVPPVDSGVQSNPYARTFPPGQRPRPMFVSGNQFYQNSQPPPLHSTPAPSVGTLLPPPQANVTTTPPSTGIAPPPPSNFTPPSFEKFASASPPPNEHHYQPVSPHWFHCKALEGSNVIWCPFSYEDSKNLEQLYQRNESDQHNTDTISTDGGRYDVVMSQRVRKSIYWDEPPSSVRRCRWFYKADTENLFTPYEEDQSEKLEVEYHKLVSIGLWHKGIDIGNKETVVVHNPQLIVHYQPESFVDDFGGVHERSSKSKVVKRGVLATDFASDIPESEVGVPDHVVFFCHGVGPVCDLRSRSIVECVDDIRRIQLSLLQSHFKNAKEAGKAKRVEFLPIHWHRALHGDATGVDRNIRRLTLPSISRLRHFTNETLLDILFYSSPVYCQTIAETIGNEINSLYRRFVSRNPRFSGKVSLAGHSLGALILFDLLCHQSDSSKSTDPISTVSDSSTSSQPTDVTHNPEKLDSIEALTLEGALQQLNLEGFLVKFEQEQIDMDTLFMCSESDLKDIGLPLGPRKKIMGFVKEHSERQNNQKAAQQTTLLANTEPAMDSDPASQSCMATEDSGSILSSAMNVHVDFQQFDSGTGQPAVCYPKLDFHPQTLFALGSPIGMFLTVRGIAELGEDFALPTCPSFINVFHPFDPVAYRVEPLINPDVTLKPVLVPHYKGRKRLHLELKESLGRMGQELKQGIMKSVRLAVGSMQRFAQSHWNQTQQTTEAAVEEEVHNMAEQLMRNQHPSNESDETASITSEVEDVGFGKLNGGKRIDYVLQERPLESFNDYLFAFQSHLCYWNSEDAVLLMMKEVYSSIDVLSDRQIARLQLPTTP